MKKDEAFSEMFCLDIETLSWQKIQTTGNKPIVWGLTASAVGSKIYYFGGEGIGGKLSSTLYCFDTATRTWNTPDVTGATPIGRSQHTATLVNDKLYVLGGKNVEEDIHNFHFLDLSKMEWHRMDVSGDVPSPKKRHTTVHYNNKLYVFGGWCQRTHQLVNDLDVFDLQSKEWIRQQPRGPVPEKRGGHMAFVYGSSLFVWGGFGPGAGPEWTSLHYMDLETGTWLKRKARGRDVPAPRSDFAYTMVKDKILIFGGLTDPKTNTASNELYFLDVRGIY